MLKKLLRKRLATVLVVFVIFIVAGSAWGAETISSPVADRTGKITGTKYLDYPLRFSGLGKVTLMGDRSVVIGDSEIRFAAGATFNIPILKNVTKSMIDEGDIVGIIVDSEGHLESLWTLEHYKDLTGNDLNAE